MILSFYTFVITTVMFVPSFVLLEVGLSKLSQYVGHISHLEYVGHISEVEDVVELDGCGQEAGRHLGLGDTFRQGCILFCQS